MTDQPQVSGFILVHPRSGGDVHFGPFATAEEALDWLFEVGRDNNVRAYLLPLINPAAPPEYFWDMAPHVDPEDLIKPICERLDLRAQMC
jgi:hypothetical protein